MTEEEWMTCDDADQMVYVVEQSGSARKLRLFTLYTCVRLCNLIGMEDTRTAIATGEQVADGLLPASSLESQSRRFGKKAIPLWGNLFHGNVGIVPESYPSAFQAHALSALSLALQPSQTRQHEQTSHGKTVSTWPVNGVVYNASMAVRYALLARGVSEADANKAVRDQARAQADLLRHIFGNPFKPYAAPDHWPANVVQVANAIYNGEDCGFALHDALLEAGHPDLADHFPQESSHPKGCWVVDLLLGKE